MEHLQDNALESELTPNEPEILPETELETALQAAGFINLEDVFAQNDVTSLVELHEALEQQVDSETTEDNPILGLIRAIGRLLGIGRKSNYHRYRNRKMAERAKNRRERRNARLAKKGKRTIGGNYSSIKRTRRRKKSQSTIPSTNVKTPVPSTRPYYNIAPLPAMKSSNKPSHSKASMKKMPVKVPPHKKIPPPPPPFRAPLKPYHLDMLEPQGPAFTDDTKAVNEAKEMANYLERDSTYKLVITIGYRLAGAALTSTQMNSTKLPTGGFIAGPSGKPVTPNQALQNRASFMLKQLAKYIKDPALRSDILSGRSTRVIITIDRNTTSGPPGAKIQAFR